MANKFSPMAVTSLKDHFIREMENRIFSGTLKPGDRLPAERELSKQIGVSRSIVNSGILELATKGFIRIVPRKGSFVCDFRNEGTLAILSALLHHLGEDMDEDLFINTNTTRRILEMESARAAAALRSNEDLGELSELIEEMDRTEDVESLISLNVRFHYRLAAAAGNSVLSILLRSFDDVIRQVLRYFYAIPGAIASSQRSHTNLYNAVRRSDESAASDAMRKIFEESEKIFRDFRAGV